MNTWTDALAPDDQRIVGWLLEHGCEFIWRDGPRGDPSSEPIESEACWFEAWCGPELLSFLGPFGCPLPPDSVRTAGQFIFRQILTLITPKHRQ